MRSGTRQSPVGAVLVVDDSTSMRQALAHRLERAGCRVTTAAEGIEALWRARQSTFDLVVTDLHMQAMTGLELLAELRKLPTYESTPVIMLTSDSSRERRAQARQLGVTAWLTKPVDVAVLVFTVRRALDVRRRAPNAR